MTEIDPALHHKLMLLERAVALILHQHHKRASVVVALRFITKRNQDVHIPVLVEIVARHFLVAVQIGKNDALLPRAVRLGQKYGNILVLTVEKHIIGHAVIIKIPESKLSAHFIVHIAAVAQVLVKLPGSRVHEIRIAIPVEIDGL